jgi:hypothetical protein
MGSLATFSAWARWGCLAFLAALSACTPAPPQGWASDLPDGRDGSLLWGDSLGCVGFSSPLAADLDGDGLDEVIFSSNAFPCARHEKPSATHTFWRLSLAKGRPEALLEGGMGKNVASTPWLGDLDGNGKLDFVYCLQANALRLHEFYGIRVACQRLGGSALPPPATGAYMGNAYDGHARLK